MEKTKMRNPLRGKKSNPRLDSMLKKLHACGQELNMTAIKKIFMGILIFFVTMLMGMTNVFSTVSPLGASMLLSLNRYVPASFGGMLASALAGRHKIPFFLVACAIFALRTWISREYAQRKKIEEKTVMRKDASPIYREPLFIRVILSVFAAFLLGMVKLIGDGYQPADFGSMIFSMALCPAATYLFSGLAEETDCRSIPGKTAMYAMVTAVVYAVREYSLFGFSAATLCAFFLTVWIAAKGGLMRGGIVGILTGMAGKIVYTPAFAIAGMLTGLLWEINGSLSVAIGALGAAAAAILINGFTALRNFAPDVVVAAALMIPLVQLQLFPPIPEHLLPESERAEHRPRERNPCEVIVWKRETERKLQCLEALSSALSGLSEVCMSLSRRLRKPSKYQVRKLVEEVFESRCSGCMMKALCCRNEPNGLHTVRETVSMQLYKSGCCKRESLPEDILLHCRHVDQLLAEVNGFYTEMLENHIRSDKTEILALEYDAMSKILEETSKRENNDFVRDDRLTEEIQAAAKMMRFPAESIAVLGTRKKTILAGGIKLNKMTLSSDEIRIPFEQICGVPMTAPQFAMDEGYVSMTMMAKNLLSCETASVSSKKANETINGDHILSFDNQDGQRYILISDGMGSGYEAALTSKICGIFLEKLLGAGCSLSLSLEMLNNFIRNRNMECFATIDLLRIDLLTKEALFVKSGAAPSYIYRDGSLFKVASHTMPIGITREINAEEIKFDLKDGDIIVMTSDGAVQPFDEGVWLTEMICYEWEDDLEHMAGRILERAEEKNLCRDDITVGLTRVREVNAPAEHLNAKEFSMEMIAE